MKEHPILFSTPMVKAILAGRKTMTRRLFKVNKMSIKSPNEEIVMLEGTFNYLSTGGLSGPYECPHGKIGDRLWVRETYTDNGLGYYRYKADGWKKGEGPFIGKSVPDKFRNKWMPSIFMPRKACRIILEITEIKVERLQDISEQDAIAEGIEKLPGEQDPFAYRSYHVKPGKEQLIPCAPFVSFRTLWQSINGYKSWEENPWVWVISFKKI